MREILPVLMPVTQQKQIQMEVPGILVPDGMAMKQNLVTAMLMEFKMYWMLSILLMTVF